MEFMDIFNDDAFSLVSLTAMINEIDYVPGRVGELCFAGAAEGIATTTAAIERLGTSLSLVPTSARGGPAPKEKGDKATLRSLSVPHIKLEDTIRADEVAGVRELGTTDQLRTVQSVVNRRMAKMTSRFDLTIEHLRLGALKGIILDADGSTVIHNLFTEFGVAAPADVGFALTTATTDVRGKCDQVIRYMKRNVKAPWTGAAQVRALCGDNFFDALISHANVKAAYANWNAAERALAGSFVHSVFPFGGIIFENYQGTDDNSTVAIGTDECRFFVTGIPGLYAEYYSPGTFIETVNTIGLPRYAKLAPDNRFNEFVELHVQTNPLPLCLRPLTLVKGTKV